VDRKDKLQKSLMTSLKNYVHDTLAAGRGEYRTGRGGELLIEEE